MCIKEDDQSPLRDRVKTLYLQNIMIQSSTMRSEDSRAEELNVLTHRTREFSREFWLSERYIQAGRSLIEENARAVRMKYNPEIGPEDISTVSFSFPTQNSDDLSARLEYEDLFPEFKPLAGLEAEGTTQVGHFGVSIVRIYIDQNERLRYISRNSRLPKEVKGEEWTFFYNWGDEIDTPVSLTSVLKFKTQVYQMQAALQLLQLMLRRDGEGNTRPIETITPR